MTSEKMPKHEWSFQGVTGTFDRAAIQRGYKVFREVCAGCHSMKLLYYRDLIDIGFSEAQVKVAVQVAEQIADYLKEGAITNSINSPSISAAEAPLLKPWIKVSDILGGFIGQVIESGLQEINIEYVGSVGELNTRPLTCSIVASILNPIVGIGSVNLVSSLIFAPPSFVSRILY